MTIGVLIFLPLIFYLWLTFGWFSAIKTRVNIKKNQQPVSISVVVPFRNEGQQTAALLEQLEHQVYDVTIQWEVIFVNDYSEDKGEEHLAEQIKRASIDVKLIHAKEKGKKAAQHLGIGQATGQHILTLDADVHIGEKWLQSMVDVHLTNEALYTAGPVLPTEGKGWWSRLVALEFLSLQASTEGSFHRSQPFMSNGANSMFEVDAWREAEVIRHDAGLASGDDVFLLHALHALGKKTAHASHIDAAVYTDLPLTFKALMNQRSRWAAKTSHYKSRFAQAIAIAVFLLALFQLFGWMISFYLWGIVWLTKTIADMAIVKRMAAKYHLKAKTIDVLVLALIYPIYITMVVAMTLLQVPQPPNKHWK